MADTIILTKAGPRLVDIYRGLNELSTIVNGPGMLYEKLELLTNRSAVNGATFALGIIYDSAQHVRGICDEIEVPISIDGESRRKAFASPIVTVLLVRERT